MRRLRTGLIAVAVLAGCGSVGATGFQVGPLDVAKGDDTHPTRTALAAVLKAGRLMDWGEVGLRNTSKDPITIDEVSLFADSSPAEPRLVDARIVMPKRRSIYDATFPHSGIKNWGARPVAAKGAVVKPYDGNPDHEYRLALTVGPGPGSAISWITGVNVTYSQGDERRTQLFPFSVVFCPKGPDNACRDRTRSINHDPLPD